MTTLTKQLTPGSLACRWTGLLLAVILATSPLWAAEPAGNSGKQGDQKKVQDGISVEVKVEPVDGRPGPVREGQEARIRLKFTDKLTGSPLSALYPGGWMDRAGARRGAGQEVPADCQKKVQAFIGGSMLSRPELDLNTYYVLALNEDATISVVDPLFGYGNSKLLTMVFLKSPGEDWALSADGERLFVSMPDSGSVAVVDASSWKVLTEIATGPHPRRLALQPDGQYLWVATDAGVSILDARGDRGSYKVADVATGQGGHGGHDIAFSGDSRFAFVANEADGTVSVVDTGRLAKLRDVKVGVRPVSLAWSTQGQAVYVTTAGDGAIVAVDAKSPKPVARIASTPGLGQIRFAPGGRLAFVVHPKENTVLIVDAASNRIVQTADVEKEPDQVAFSDELAYIRHRGSETVLMIPLKTVGEPGKPVAVVVDFPGGQHPPGRMPRPTPAAGIVQAPGSSAVLVANPEDQVIYFYKEGMAAPMGHFNNYGKQPRATLVVDRSLREVKPGVYETTARMAAAGDYELALFVDSPKLVQCFPVKVAADPALAAARKPALGVEPAGDVSK
ncbi:MAG TPA: cytochrome D1 domain-containing protein, partial [Thermoanaerobaculia bacterium]|nr:cytochrome D1 domain-containing protein [Thermoanaerobaculia bacterium]